MVPDRDSELAERYQLRPAAAFVRGALADGDPRPLDALSPAELEALIARGLEADLDLHNFKRSRELPRVARVLGILRGLRPTSLLDLGCGRGVFLWPLLEALPGVPVIAVDSRASSLARVATVARGGLPGLRALRADAAALALADGAVEVVTALEVLEHLAEPARAVRELLRVARRFVVFSVPSRPDENPEHLRLFSADELAALFREAGAAEVRVEHVLGHRVGLARVT